jgi:hypothetical protein
MLLLLPLLGAASKCAAWGELLHLNLPTAFACCSPLVRLQLSYISYHKESSMC